MSANIYFRVAAPKQEARPKANALETVMAPESFLSAMRRAFGEGENCWVLSVEDIPVIRGMAAARLSGAEELLRKLETLDSEGLLGGLEIWAEY